jgi:hypothetical protein
MKWLFGFWLLTGFVLAEDFDAVREVLRKAVTKHNPERAVGAKP